MGAFYGQETGCSLKQGDLHAAESQRGRHHRVLIRSDLHLDTHKDRTEIIKARVLKTTRYCERLKDILKQRTDVDTCGPAKIKSCIIFSIDQVTSRLIDSLTNINLSCVALHALSMKRVYSSKGTGGWTYRGRLNPNKAIAKSESPYRFST